MTSSGVPRMVDSATTPERAVGANGDEGFIKVLFSRGDGSRLLVGTFRLEPGQRGTFTLPHVNGMEEEIYFLLAGRLAVRWDDGELTAERGQAIFFPAGGTYEIETLGTPAAELVWTAFPPPQT